MVQGAGAGNSAAADKEPHESLEKCAHAGSGLCRAADRRAVRWGRHRRGPGADPRPAKRAPLELPLRFHGELFRRAEGRERSHVMSERQCREALRRLPAGGKGGDAGASSKASRTVCHSDTCGSGTLRFTTSASASAGRSRRRHTAGSCCRFCCCYRSRGKTGCPCCIDAASAAGTAGSGQTGRAVSAASEKRGETSSERPSPRRRPACRDCRRAAPGVPLGAHKMPCRVPRLLLRCGHRGRPRGCLPAIERRVAFTNLPKRLGRVGPLTSRKPADYWRDE